MIMYDVFRISCAISAFVVLVRDCYHRRGPGFVRSRLDSATAFWVRSLVEEGFWYLRVPRLLLPQLRRSQNIAVFCHGASLFPQTVPSNTGSGTSLNSTFLSRKESSSLWNLSSKSGFNSSSIRENSTMTLNSLRFGNLLIVTACSN